MIESVPVSTRATSRTPTFTQSDELQREDLAVATIAGCSVGLGGAYVFDQNRLARRLSALANLVGDLPVRWAFPVKTAPFLPVLREFARAGFALDVSNEAELRLAEPLQTPLWLNGPAAHVGALAPAERLTFVLSSASQLTSLAASGCRRVGLRLNASDLLGSDEPRSFGFERREAIAACDELRRRGTPARVLHAHCNTALDGAGYATLLQALLEIRAQHAPEVEVVDIGGGQFRHFRELEALALLVRRLSERLPAGVSLGIESGGAHFAHGIYLAAPVIDVIERSTRYDLVVGACLSAALQWSRAEIRLRSASVPGGKPVWLRGASCDEADQLGELAGLRWDASSAKPHAGDTIVLARVSPYAIGRSFAFNGIPRPELITVE